MTRFEGFADADGKFFKALAKKNERPWFLAHKAEYEAGWREPMTLLLAAVRERIDAAYAHSDLGEPKVFRIFRDVRFSKDKSPYKTNIGGCIPMSRRGAAGGDVPMALYFHVGADESFGAAGHYMMGPASLQRFRRAVADGERGAEIHRILQKLERKGFSAASHDAMKRVPKGYEPDHERAELLKRKGLYVRFPSVPKGVIATPKLVPWVVSQCKAVAPFVEWLVFATA